MDRALATASALGACAEGRGFLVVDTVLLLERNACHPEVVRHLSARVPSRRKRTVPELFVVGFSRVRAERAPAESAIREARPGRGSAAGLAGCGRGRAWGAAARTRRRLDAGGLP